MSSEFDELEKLASKIIAKLTELKLTIGLAESCTGGLASHILTNIRGASKVFLYSAVVYTAVAKHELLNVPWEIINEYGTISIETNRALMDGMKEKLNPDFIIAYTGVTDQVLEGKPSGYVIIGLQTPEEQRIEERTFSGSRLLVKKQAVLESFKLLMNELEKL